MDLGGFDCSVYALVSSSKHLVLAKRHSILTIAVHGINALNPFSLPDENIRI